MEAMSVALFGTGRRTLVALALFRKDRGAMLLEEERPWSEVVRMCLGFRAEGREGGEGASPKMKNLMKHPRKITTDSCPRRNPWVKVKPEDMVKGGVSRDVGEERIHHLKGI